VCGDVPLRVGREICVSDGARQLADSAMLLPPQVGFVFIFLCLFVDRITQKGDIKR